MTNALLSASGLDQQIGFALRQASTSVWTDLVKTLGPFGLRPQSYATLLLIEAHPGCKQQDIADALNIQRPNMVALIDGLVDAGQVARVVNPQDRRSYALTLTKVGRDLLENARGGHRAHEARIAARIDPGEYDVVLRGCMALATL